MTEHDLRHLLDTAADDKHRDPLTSAAVVGAADRLGRRRRTIVSLSLAAAAVVTIAAIGLATRTLIDDPAGTAGPTSPTPSATEPTQGNDALGDPSAQCAMKVRFDGHVYEGAPQGNPDRTPELTGRTVTVQVPACDDGGGATESEYSFTLEEIAGVPMSTAVWGNGLLVRRGATLPPLTDDWYGKPTCTLTEPAQLVGQWVGVMTEKEVRFDGDLRPPLYVDVDIEPDSGNPADLERYTLRIHDYGDAAPGLDRHMAEEALWSARAALEITVTCDGPRFVATAFALRPRG
jgi:hypothetical protein